MRIAKLPIPLLIAAAALTSVVYIYVYLTAPPMPIHTDPNFSRPLISGVTYLWRGAAFQYVFSADSQISMAYGTPYHLVYLFGPLYNISLAGGKIFIIYGANIRPLYVFKTNLETESGYHVPNICLIYKLKDVTPQNLTSGNLTLYLPEVFNVNDVLKQNEDTVVYNFANCVTRYRVVYIQVNGTHIIFHAAYSTHPSLSTNRYVLKLQTLAPGKTIRVTNQPISGSYVAGSATFEVIVLPYLHFAITPQDTTTLTVYVS